MELGGVSKNYYIIEKRSWHGNVFSSDAFNVEKNTICRPAGSTSWKTLDEAKLECSKDPKCSMFYDPCGKGYGYIYCTHTATIHPPVQEDDCVPILYNKGKLKM